MKTIGALRSQDRHKARYAYWKPGYFHGDVNTAVFQKVAPVFPKPAQYLSVLHSISHSVPKRPIPSFVGSIDF